MNSPLFTDRRATGLLNRVRDDVSNLRDDIGHLLSHTTRETLPKGARELADQARNQLAAGGAYAASRLRDFRGAPPRQSAGIVGVAIVAGLVAYGVYALSKKCCENRNLEESDEYDPENSNNG
jgi:hypothetical protein